jgi:3-dehydroquinate dehydratase-2
MNNKIIIINGPNLNLLGEREQSQYGSTTFEELKEICIKKSKELGLLADFYQSNIEGEIVSLIQSSRINFDGIIINAAAYTHTSVGIGDAIKAIDTKVIEVHISNTFSREEYRHNSYLSPVVDGIIIGFGLKSYELAIESFLPKDE